MKNVQNHLIVLDFFPTFFFYQLNVYSIKIRIKEENTSFWKYISNLDTELEAFIKHLFEDHDLN